MAKNEDHDAVILYLPLLVIDCYWCGFGRIQDRFDLIIPPSRIANISMGSIGLYPLGIKKVGRVTSVGTIIVKNHARRGFREKNLQNKDTVKSLGPSGLE
jgi:hypothetical protein